MCKLNWPPFSEVSSFECPGGGKSSKFLLIKRPNMIPRIGKASIIAGQLLLPTPKGRVVSKPQCIHKDLAFSWNVKPAKLSIMEVHVWD
nr:hypothetical protein CFP56_21472 [Quercus suber]